MVKVQPGVALRIMEEEPGFVRRMSRYTKMKVDVRDDPLLGQDDFRFLSGPAETDVTAKYAAA